MDENAWEGESNSPNFLIKFRVKGDGFPDLPSKVKFVNYANTSLWFVLVSKAESRISRENLKYRWLKGEKKGPYCRPYQANADSKGLILSRIGCPWRKKFMESKGNPHNYFNVLLCIHSLPFPNSLLGRSCPIQQSLLSSIPIRKFASCQPLWRWDGFAISHHDKRRISGASWGWASWLFRTKWGLIRSESLASTREAWEEQNKRNSQR